MNRSDKSPRTKIWQTRSAFALLLCLTQWPTQASAQALAPSQQPLLSQAAVVAPNLMVTLDTSWSMIFPYMPEGEVKLPGGTASFPGYTSAIMHPDDTRFTVDMGRAAGDGGVISGDPTSAASVFQMQMRSPDVNSIYYNPEIRYQPWLIAVDNDTGKETRYAPADPKKAWFDPDNPGDGAADLTLVEASREAVWCNNPPPLTGDKLKCATSSKPFNPGLYYRLDGNCSPSQNPNDPKCFVKYDVNGGGVFTRYPQRTDCASPALCTAAEELQNYANWFVYYRNRLEITQAAIPETFLHLKDGKLRVGWATIHQGVHKLQFEVPGKTISDTVDTRNVVSGIDNMDADRKQGLIKWIRNFQSNNTVNKSTPDPVLHSGTPLLGALTGVGDYFSRTDVHSPWTDDPNGGSKTVANSLSCRRSYNLLITDGYYNDSAPTTSAAGPPVAITNEDNTSSTTPITDPSNTKSYAYTARPPYQDQCSGTLADVAMHYWKNDLQPTLDNIVPAGKDILTQDPAYWQHLVQFAVGLGVSGNISYNDLPNQLDLLATGSKSWWPAVNSTDGNCLTNFDPAPRVDDLLHAAINSRGQYFSVNNAVELTTALNGALTRASRQEGLKQAGVALISQVTGGNNVKYVPQYTTEQWIGDVKAYAANGTGWQTEPLWSATEKLPSATARNVVTFSGGRGVPFTSWDNLDKADQARITPKLPAGATGQQLIDYIRGDTSQEDAAVKLKLFRARDSLIADIINSTPTLLKGNVNLHYDLMPSSVPGQSSYLSFLATKAARAPLLFVGDNGGMLHAFDDNETNPGGTTASTNRGREVFAYVPNAALAKLGNFARRDYGNTINPHQYMVDGPLTESDAYFGQGDAAASWHNVLIGTMGAGGKAIFALDVTPDRPLDANTVLWERSSDTPDCVACQHFGYMLGDAQVGMLPNNEWVAFVGNGPYSANGHAVLMMINLSTGVVSSVDASSTGDTANGLGAVTLVKDSNQQVRTIYAGDLHGKLWRFDASDTGQVSVDRQGQALFAGTATQPITAAPAVVPHPKGGNMVVFGTGQLFDDTDPANTAIQTVYGVWDAPAGGTTGAAQGQIGSDKLVVQTLVPDPIATGTNGTKFYKLNITPVDYAKQAGWSMNLTLNPGQRVIYPLTVLKGHVFVNTVAPALPSDTPSCDPHEGSGYTFLLSALMDKSTIATKFALVNGSYIDASGYSHDATGRNVITLDPPCEGPDCKQPPCEGPECCVGPDCKPPCTSIETHFQDVRVEGTQGGTVNEGSTCKIGSRIWRQLLNPPQP